MTSKTLTGKKREMEADAGDKYQVDVLSNAEVWVPKENEDLDLSTYFSSQVMYYKMLFPAKSHFFSDICCVKFRDVTIHRTIDIYRNSNIFNVSNIVNSLFTISVVSIVF